MNQKAKRISVAVLAPVWQVGDERLTVGIMNKASLAKGRKSASAFGGAVTLDRVEMTVVRHLGGTPEREGSSDARLICDDEQIVIPKGNTSFERLCEGEEKKRHWIKRFLYEFTERAVTRSSGCCEFV